MRETWKDGHQYDRFIGRWSRPVAEQFVAWLEAAPGLRWLDVGCGTGALTQTVLDLAKPEAVKGVDASQDYIAAAQRVITAPVADFAVCDAEALCVKTGSYDVAVSGLCLNFVPDPEQAVKEAARAVVRGGKVAAYVWDYSAGMEMLRAFWDAAVAVDAAAAAFDEGLRFPACRPDALAQLFAGAGLRGVETRAIDVATIFSGFDDYWEPFMGGQGPAPSYVASLSPGSVDALRSRLSRSLPRGKDGTIALTARAWAVKGETAKN